MSPWISGHIVTVEQWNRRVIVLCTCSPIPISTRVAQSDEAGDYTTDDVDGFTMDELNAMVDEHLQGAIDR